MAAAAARANAFFVDEAYPKALEAYTAAITEMSGPQDDGAAPSLADVLARRSATHMKLHDAMAALDDARAALRLEPQHSTAAYRKGLACFEMGEYETAKAAFEQSLKAPTTHASLQATLRKWLRKCQAEIECDDDSSDDDVGEATPARFAGAGAGSGGAGGGSSAPSVPAPAAAPAPVPAAAAAAASAPAPSKSSNTMASQVRYDWYESAQWVTIDVMSKNIDKEASEAKFETQALDLSLAMRDGSTYVMDIQLAGKIDPSKSSITFRKVKAEVKLVKVSPYDWGALEASAVDVEMPDAPAAVATADPVADKLPAPYAHKKDWSQIEREIEEAEKEDKPEGEDALRGLFQQIYKGASEDTRRAMIKSFQTSGGTVLSTNWDEVSKQDYEKTRQAPEGMEWKKWG